MKFAEKVCFVLFSLLLASSLLYSNLFFLSFELPKIIAVRIIIEVLLLFFTVFYLSRFRFKLDIFDWLGTFWILVLVFSSIRAGSFEYSFWGGFFRHQGIFTQIHLIMLFIVGRRIFGYFPKIIDKILNVLILISVLQSTILVFQAFEVFVLHSDISTYAGRVIGTFGQPNMAAGLLATGFAVSLGLFLSTKSKKYVVSAGLTALGLLSIESLGGLMAVSAAFLMFLLLYIKSFSLKLIVGVLIILSVFVFGVTGLVKEKITYSDMSVPRIESRLSIWPATVKLFLKRPLLGYGAESLQFIFPAEFGGASIDRAHNFFLDTLIWGGVYLGGIYLAFVLFGFIKGFTGTYPALALGFLAIIVRDMVNTSSIINLILFWLILAGILLKREEATKSQTQYLSIVIALLIVFTGTVISYRLGIADHYFGVYRETGNTDAYKKFNQNSLIPIPKQ